MQIENKIGFINSECCKVLQLDGSFAAEFCEGLRKLLCCCCGAQPKPIEETQSQVGGQTPRFFQGTSRTLTRLKRKKTALLHLYLHQKYGELSANQCVPCSIEGSTSYFGTIAVNDWTVHETSDPNSTAIARARGLHTGCNQNKEEWYSSFNMVFEDQEYSGSSLEVHGMWGIHTNSRFEWAIVGGTGKYRLAQGIISGNIITEFNGLRVFQLTIHVLYHEIHDADVHPVGSHT